MPREPNPTIPRDPTIYVTAPRRLEDVARTGAHGLTIRSSLEHWWFVVKLFPWDDSEEAWATWSDGYWSFECGEGVVYRKREAGWAARILDGEVVNAADWYCRLPDLDGEVVNAADWYCRLPDEYRHTETRAVREAVSA